MVYIVAIVKKETTKDALNAILRNAAANGPLKGILEYTEEELVSTDFKQNPHSSIVDGKLTGAQGTLIQIGAWYDNEWGSRAGLPISQPSCSRRSPQRSKAADRIPRFFAVGAAVAALRQRRRPRFSPGYSSLLPAGPGETVALSSMHRATFARRCTFIARFRRRPLFSSEIEFHCEVQDAP